MADTIRSTWGGMALLTGALGVWLLLGHAPAFADDKADVAKANNRFAFELYRKLAEDKAGANLFFSPHSIAAALNMSATGAEGETLAQMLDVLHAPDDPKGLRRGWSELSARLADVPMTGDRPAYELRIANGLFAQKEYPVRPRFIEGLETSFQAKALPVDFFRNHEEARATVNAWVEKQTKNRITNLFPSGTIDPLTRLVLANAVFFKGDWLSQFDRSQTTEGDFTTPAAKKILLPMMTQRRMFRYFENDQLQALSLRYKGDSLYMTLILPRTVEGFAGVEKSLSVENLNTWTNGDGDDEMVQLTLPRFKASSEFALKPALSALGMKDAFIEQKANFQGIASVERLYITHVMHKAFVEVNEEGSEAAAATGVAFGVRSAGPPRFKTFTANRPFFYLIRHRESDAILFLGRYLQPESVGSPPSNNGNPLPRNPPGQELQPSPETKKNG